MAAYLQLGHDSWNLVDDPETGDFAGIVLSPVNDGPAAVRDRLTRLGDARLGLEVILDPQLYNPAADRGSLNEWSYYPADFETADRSDARWWAARGREVVADAVALGIEAVCSPAHMARSYDDLYYRFIVEIADETRAEASRAGLDTLLTAIVPLRDLAQPNRAFEIASILSGSECDRIYLTFLCEDIQQREPMRDGSGLATAVHLLRLLSRQMRVHVAFCSHDLVVWKCAGATDVSTGKFMNLRRLSPSRWQEDETNGRIVSYWNEGALLTLLRDQDVLRLDRARWYDGEAFGDNEAAARIAQILRSSSGEPWLAHSWRQYLRWVSTVEERWRNPTAAEDFLEASDRKWGDIERARIQFTDRFNDGVHVRTWLNAVREGAAR